VRFSEVCIERPVFTTVMSLVIVLVGTLGLFRLSNRELPDIDPPIVTVTTIFAGASAQVVETSLTKPIEDAVNGIDGVKHVTSTSREQVSSIKIEFSLARDIEAAANDVRDRVARIRSKLPDDVEDPVVAKQDSDASPIIWMALYGENTTQIELTQLADTVIVDRLSKLPGVASVINAGERRYSMRIWVDNRRLGARDISISELVEALRREHVDIPSGRIESEDAEFTVRSLGELKTPAEWRQLVVAVKNGVPIYLGDVADVETGPEDERKLVRFNGLPAIGLGIVKQSKANTLDAAAAIHAEVGKLEQELPNNIRFEVAFDSSQFIRQSIVDVIRTIFEAAALVLLVIYVFLRSFRATIVPAVAIPVSIIGSLGFLYFAGFTINTLTLMGVTLAIGLVVDDAIVVLENITRWVEEGTPPMQAARQGMSEISFAVVASTISAIAVFLPLVFLQDTTGKLFREFAVTVASAVGISGFVALTLSPMMSARVLRAKRDEGALKQALGRGFEAIANRYSRMLGPVVRHSGVALGFVVFGVLWAGMGGWLYTELPDELMPTNDRNVIFVITLAPEGSTVEYMDRYQRMAEEKLEALPEVRRNFSLIALGFGTPGAVNRGIVISMLAPRAERDLSQSEVADIAKDVVGTVPGIKAFIWEPSPVRGMSSSPVEIVIQGPDLFELARIADEVESQAEEEGFEELRSNLELNKPQLEVAIDRDRASDLGMSVREISTALQMLLGGLDITTFKQDGETYNVMVQLRKRERESVRDMVELFVRGNSELIPLASVVTARETIAPRELPHFDRMRAVTLTGKVPDSMSQGDALRRIYQIAQEKLPIDGDYRVQFSGEAEKFFESGNALVFAYLLALLVVYLVLAAQFESFVYPIAIMVAVLLSFTGALIALQLFGMTLNIFSKIGIVMLVGLVTKNSILIVEFANQLRGRGMDLTEATIQAARTRFRPILMTSLATMVGILPIALGMGAGGESRAPLGTAVVGGMFFSTILTYFVVPATYVTLERARERLRGRSGSQPVLGANPAPVAGGE
jgi:multidrug efflux pump